MVRTWSPGVAAVLSVFVPGLGHVYKGRMGAGFVLFIATVVGYMLLILPGLLIHLGVIFDAYNGPSKEELESRPRGTLNAPPTAEQRVRSRRETRLILRVLAGLAAFVVVVMAVSPWLQDRTSDGTSSQSPDAPSRSPTTDNVTASSAQRVECRIPELTFTASYFGGLLNITFAEPKPSPRALESVVQACGAAARTAFDVSGPMTVQAFMQTRSGLDQLARASRNPTDIVRYL
jgi:hypothetical protein